MFLKLLFKYKIAELFIETLFEKVSVNFLHKFRGTEVGSFYSRIDEYYQGRKFNRYYDCTILSYDASVGTVRFKHGDSFNYDTRSAFKGSGATTLPLSELTLLL